MKILEFGFDPKGNSDYMPHNCVNHSVCYVGTHDNEVVKGWVKHTDRDTLRFAREYMHKGRDESWCSAMLRTGMSTASQLFVMQMQDILELGAESRINTPGILGGNWQWRMRPDLADKKLARKIRKLTETYRRL